MIQRINNYLLTHYPLLWNTRLLWVAIVNISLHLLFLLAGISSISAGSIADYYSVGRVGGGNQYTLSILCGLVVLIIWCVFYLRNNAFKSYYRIGKWYLAKEFAIIFLVVFSSISYFLSYEWGVRAKVRSITNEVQLIQEINTVNRAAVYIAQDQPAYFILNTCAERNRRIQKNKEANANPNRQGNSVYDYESEELDIADSFNLNSSRDSGRSLLALRRSDAFSYLHYCRQLVRESSKKTDPSETISQRNQRWLRQGRKDSVKAALQDLFVVLNKYSLKYRLSVDSIVKDVFSDTGFTMDALIPENKFKDVMGYQVGNTFYINSQEIKNVFSLIEDCQPGGGNGEDRVIVWNIVGYVALSFSILLLCYRRFSRKVFLISVIGTLVWAIIFGLIAVSGSSSNGFAIMVLLCCGVFGGIGLWQLWQNKNKTMSGVLLNWHVYLAPYVVLLIVAIISMNFNNYNDYGYVAGTTSYEDYLKLHYPFSYWVKQYSPEIFLANLAVCFLYIAFIFNNWTKRWQLMAEE